MVESNMQVGGGADDMNDGAEGVMNEGEGRMVTALTWISRGFAKPQLQMADPELDARNIMAHSRL